jgi:predicted ATPase/class 3 adenylate cyclase
VKSATLPTGTVAFLFSDIEGSTRRWDADREAMRDALRRHDEILRFEIERRRGYVFKTIGDAFCAAFWTIPEALEAAVEAQRRLGSEDLGPVGGLAVRMAIHAGETDERSGDYFGPALNRTARLLSAGHGGQVLLSGFAADLALPALRDGVTLRHLGTLPLRDLKEPERVYQPTAKGLRSEFKPLRALETPPNNLPRQVTSFVGRQEDAMRVEVLLNGGALVTLVGAGGIGKTRLALEVAASRINDERDGAWFVDLSTVTEGGLIAGTILSVLGAQLRTDGETVESLLEYLAKRELLLLLDNSEHLVAEVASIVAQIVARCPQVTVLATSREPLDLSGERVYRLSSLDSASAVQLFADRALAADPTFRLDGNRATIEEICGRMDGMALAIELAAARVKSMSLENLSRRLELRMLAGGRDRRPRQQTMQALIDWSYALLAPDERRCLRRCALFVGGFSLEVAETVCDDGPDSRAVLDLLSSLVDKSLIVLDTREMDQRYRLLEPIRQYAREKLVESDETAEISRRHACAFAACAAATYEQWDTGPQADWLGALQRDLSNFRAALRWTVEDGNDLGLGAQMVADTTLIFLRLALLSEGVEWCKRVLGAGLALPNAIEARLRYGLSMLYSNIGVNKKVLEEALIAASLYRRAGDPRGLARALSQVASRYAQQSRDDEAKAAAEEALALARDSGDDRLVADTLRRCAEAFGADGMDAVRLRYEKSVAIFRPLGRDDETARALVWWAQWEAEAGDFRAAAELMLEAGRLDSRDVVTMFLSNDVASYYLAVGDTGRAEPFAREALTAAAKAHHPVLMPLAISYLAAIASSRDASMAARLAGFAEDRLRAADWQRPGYEQAITDGLFASLKKSLREAELARLLEEGAMWNDDEAVARGLST